MKSMRSTRNIILAAMAAAAMLLAGCSTTKHEVAAASDSTKPAATQQSVAPVTAPLAVKPSTNSVYFAFDRSDLDAAARATLDAYAEWLNANNSINITIEGNCDERGSREYNLALGQRRADSIRDYLSTRGVSAARVDTVSFGEERPVCKGTGEACWAQNRRGDIVTR